MSGVQETTMIYTRINASVHNKRLKGLALQHLRCGIPRRLIRTDLKKPASYAGPSNYCWAAR
jgi:hypothetical protein